MQRRPLIFILSSIILVLSIGYIYFPRNSQPEVSEKEKPNEWFFAQRAFPFEQINHAAYMYALEQAQVLKSAIKATRNTGQWEFAGPANTGGRLSDVEMHPGDLNTIYLGAAAGGVFKSSNQGASWQPIFDEALSLSIGDIALAPSDPNIIYVGTGEANAGGGSLAYDGVGIYKSSDAGENWEYLGLEEGRNVGRMVVHPNNPNIVYVAAMGNLFADNAERGIYKTIDGGQNWDRVLYVSDSTGAIDVVIHPTNPDTLYAAMWERVRRPNRRSYGGATCGIYRSYDGGENWTELTNGLPAGENEKGRIGIDISDSDPSILYAIYADKTGYFNGVYKTFDGGDTWVQTNDGSLSNSFSSFGWWFGRIEVDPVDPDIAFVIGFDIYRTKNGGLFWTNQSGSSVHVDQHAVYIHPLNNDFIVLGNDGGLYTSVNGGNSWVKSNDLPITQFYTCEIDYQFPERLYGGTQDNGTNRTMTGRLDDWTRIYGGDGFRVMVDPIDNKYVYAEYQYGGLGRSTNGGSSFSSATSGINGSDRFNWSCPVVFDPSDPSTLYFGSNRLYKSTNRAVSWGAISEDLTNGPGTGNLAFNTLTTISVSQVNNQIIYTGSDDGTVHITLDGGINWLNISSGLPERWITRVVADPQEENIVYATISGYRWDEFIPHVFRSDNYGQSWVEISFNLPEAPVNDIIVNSVNNQILIVATDVGVYITYNGGGEWLPLGDNLPNVVVNDLVHHQPTNKLVAGTFGRSMYSYDLEQDPLTSLNEEKHLGNILIYPNPFSSETKIVIESDEKINHIRIIDLSGRRIRELSLSGNTSVKWDGSNDSGVKVPPGVYIIQIDSGGKLLTQKIIKE